MSKISLVLSKILTDELYFMSIGVSQYAAKYSLRFLQIRLYFTAQLNIFGIFGDDFVEINLKSP
jgi:hypothetical protein